MRRRLVLMPLLAVLTIPVSATAEDRPPIIAVFDVEVKGINLASGVMDNLSDYVATRLAESGKYQVVPRAQLKARLVEAKTESYNECYDESCQIELGREMAAQKTLATRIGKMGSECTVNLKVFDLGRATSETAATASGSCTEDGIVASLKIAIGRLTGSGASTQTRDGPNPGGASVRGAAAVVGGGKVESVAAIDKGESIVNRVTDETGFLVIKSEPTGATVSLNGKEIGTTPIQVEQTVGRYVVVAQLGKLYHPARQEIDLGKDGRKVTLTLPPAFGRVEVTSEPAGADVWVDGEMAGATPWSAARKPAGTYELRLVKPNYLTYEGLVTVEDGKTAFVRAVLGQNFGSLVVESNPPGASVILNGEATGKTTPSTFVTVQPGVVLVKLMRDGYGESVLKATVKNRETARVSVNLDAKMGLLVVTSAYEDGSPCTGDVRVDGKVVAQTPWKGEVVATRHEVQVRCPEGESTQAVTVEHNSRTTVKVVISTAKEKMKRAIENLVGSGGAARSGSLLWQARVGGPMNLASAQTYCRKLQLGGLSGWRLPTISELRSLVKPETEESGKKGWDKSMCGCKLLELDPCHVGWFWSSSAGRSGHVLGYQYLVRGGGIDTDLSDGWDGAFVHCVRELRERN